MFYAVAFLLLCATGHVVYAPILLIIALLHKMFSKMN
jgi:hypothetical protein